MTNARPSTSTSRFNVLSSGVVIAIVNHKRSTGFALGIAKRRLDGYRLADARGEAS